MKKNLIAIIFIGLVIGILAGVSGFQLAWSHIIIASFFFFILFMLLYILNTNRFLRHMKSGQYEEAIVLLDKQKHFGRDALKEATKNAAQLNKAICYNRMGEFARSIAELDKINLTKADKNVSWSFYGLYAGNLLLLEDRLDEAEDYIEKAHAILDFPSTYLIRCNLEQLKGNLLRADELMRAYENKEKLSKKLIFGLTFLFIDQKFKIIYDHFLIGLYYLNNHEPEKALDYLRVASQSEVNNYYTNKAREVIIEIENKDGRSL